MIEEFRRAAVPEAAKNPAVQALRAAGRPVFGYNCTNFPEEIAYAAGIVPVRALGAPGVAGEAGALRPAAQCAVSRANLELALGKGFANLDGFVVTNTCDAAQNTYAALDHFRPFGFLHFLSRPNVAHSAPALAFFRFELGVLREALEAYAGRKIADDDLRGAVAVYNRGRALLGELYDLRGREGKVSGPDFATVVLASFYLDRAEWNGLLERYLAEVRGRPAAEDSRVRVHLSGSSFPSPELFALVETAGGRVVSDDLCVGTRYFLGPVRETGDPLDALAERYLNKLACPCMHHGSKLDERYRFLASQLDEYRGQAVLFALHRFCDTHLVDYQALRYRLEADRVPFLYHEVDATLGAGQLRTKLEAFFEIIQGVE